VVRRATFPFRSSTAADDSFGRERLIELVDDYVARRGP
jgi:hypothetical protein